MKIQISSNRRLLWITFLKWKIALVIRIRSIMMLNFYSKPWKYLNVGYGERCVFKSFVSVIWFWKSSCVQFLNPFMLYSFLPQWMHDMWICLVVYYCSYMATLPRKNCHWKFCANGRDPKSAPKINKYNYAKSYN